MSAFGHGNWMTGNYYLWKTDRGDSAQGSAIMQSLDENPSLTNPSLNNQPSRSNESLSLHGASIIDSSKLDKDCEELQSFLLIDGHEYLKVSNSEQFIQKLRCPANNELKVKVVSIFGNTGDGKSHTLNQTFFGGAEVFHTSNEQSSCTLGVWGAFDPKFKVICLDTEGLLGITSHENARTRLLLKVLAVSDIVIYRTRSERLHRDMFTFLGGASRAYSHYFQAALQALSQREGMSSANTLGPSVIIFHETRHTRPLMQTSAESAEDILRDRFAQMEHEIEAFSSIKYVGVQTSNPPTDYRPLIAAIDKELGNTTVRSARKPQLVYNTLKMLNDKFSGEIENVKNILFPDQYFTCPSKCYSCECRCQNSMGHIKEGKPHVSDVRCRYQHQYENQMFICKKCHTNGNEVIVTSRVQTQNDNSWYGLAMYAWCGYVIECPNCGEIYRSRQHWFGNKSPEDAAVRTEITHVWNDTNMSITSQNTAQRVVDGVSYLSEAVASVSLQPTKMLSAWVADQIAPSYWRPNNDIRYCHKCRTLFLPTDTKHHCRACGEGFCASCSTKNKCVPERNWFTPVRVCDDCYDKDANSNEENGGEDGVGDDTNVRKVTETVVNTFTGTVGTVLTYSKSIIKDTARPTYWVPDSEVVCCCVCGSLFSDTLPLHHCRDCGKGVCADCSQGRKPVPRRGWDNPVRVCDACMKID